MTDGPQDNPGTPEPGSLEDEAVAAADAAATAPEGAPVGKMANEPFETSAERAPQEPTEVEEPLTVEGIDEVDELGTLREVADERLRDLQRLQAEYINYKRRTERDREVVVQNAKFTALAPIVEVLDNIDRAREHGEVEGGFKSVAEQLERVVATSGLVKFGAVGDAFDPMVHEALSHLGQDPEVTVTTCKVVAKAGYKIGDRVVRAAQVLVVDPADG